MLSHPASSPGGSSGEQHTAIVPIRIYYEDTDAGGLVHHSNYLRYFERGREHVLGCAKLTELFETSKRSFVVASVSIRYKKAARWGDALELRTSTVVHSPYRVEFEQDIYRGDELLVEGRVFMATVQGSGGDLQLCAFPDYILNGDIPTIPGLDRGDPAKKQLPPPKPRKAQQQWQPFGTEVSTTGRSSQMIQTVYLDDTDFTGICYNSNYLVWMERARANAIGIETLARLQSEAGIGAAIHQADITFKRGAKFAEKVLITMEARLESEYRIIFKHEVRLVAEATSRIDQSCSYFSSDEVEGMPLLVSAEISIVFLSAGGSGDLVKLPGEVRNMLPPPSVPT